MESERLLVVEDDEVVQVLVSAAVGRDGRDVVTAGTVREARSALSGHRFDLVILDLFLPDGDGRQLLTDLRERAPTANVPIVVLSARGTRSVKLECFRRGADEFFEKPVDPEILAAAVDRQLERARAVSGEGDVDPATGLPNRAELNARFEELRDAARRTEDPLPIAYLVLDAVEETEETLDRAAMDEALEEAARALHAELPSSAVVGRWRGGEFAALFPDATLERAQEAVEAFIAATSPNGISAAIVDGRPFASLRRALLEAEPGLRSARAADGATVDVRPSRGRRSRQAADTRVLVVEDDDVGAELVRHRLERSGLEVERLATGTEAQAMIESLDPPPFDVLLFDFKLPGADGMELLQLAKSRPGWRDLPVVILTSMGRESDIVRAFELGADDYVLKPFSPAELLARINRLLRGHRADG